MKPYDENELIDLAVNGDGEALERLLLGMQDFIFNLSLRMLGTVADAEDATQEILIKVMTKLSTFRKESKLSTWVYRIAVNDLLQYKKSMFANAPMSFAFFGGDIAAGAGEAAADELPEAERLMLSEELKLSCTNVMLQCLDPESRCIFVLGTMFKLDSRIAGELLQMTPENYRQKLSRVRRKMVEFLSQYCGLSGTGMCSCKRRVGYAVEQGRLNPRQPVYQTLQTLDTETLVAVSESMEALNDAAAVFTGLPAYRSPVTAAALIAKLLQSAPMQTVRNR